MPVRENPGPVEVAARRGSAPGGGSRDRVMAGACGQVQFTGVMGYRLTEGDSSLEALALENFSCLGYAATLARAASTRARKKTRPHRGIEQLVIPKATQPTAAETSETGLQGPSASSPAVHQPTRHLTLIAWPLHATWPFGGGSQSGWIFRTANDERYPSFCLSAQPPAPRSAPRVPLSAPQRPLAPLSLPIPPYHHTPHTYTLPTRTWPSCPRSRRRRPGSRRR